MKTKDNQTAAPATGLLSWLGLAQHETRGEFSGEPEIGPVSADLGAISDDARADLLAGIGDFLTVHDLAISARTLKIAHDVISGTDPQLAQKVRQRASSKQPITQYWLDGIISGQDEPATVMQYHAVMDRLELKLEAFAETTKGAYCSSAVYGSLLARQVSELGSLPVEQAAAIDIGKLTRNMLARARRVEGEMRRSESEAVSLRRSLAAARLDLELDHLTKLPNRPAFEGILTKRLEEARKVARPLSLAFCDIDNFKLVNDSHGHEAGDRVIREVADVLARGSGETCHVARHGGEEFIMLFVGLTVQEAKNNLDAIREKLARRNFVNRETELPIGQVTFSGGVADVTAFEDPRDALAAAGSALYFAKDEGRNRICLAQ